MKLIATYNVPDAFKFPIKRVWTFVCFSSLQIVVQCMSQFKDMNVIYGTAISQFLTGLFWKKERQLKQWKWNEKSWLQVKAQRATKPLKVVWKISSKKLFPSFDETIKRAYIRPSPVKLIKEIIFSLDWELFPVSHSILQICALPMTTYSNRCRYI